MNIKDMNDQELMYWYHLAQELQDSRYIKFLKDEMNRRNREE